MKSTELKASDLRIGNYVNEFNKVYSIRSEFVECFGLSFSGLITLNENDLKPIPLTEDILLKCGFYKELDSIYRRNQSYMIEFVFYDEGVLCTSQSVCLNNIQYLHQLQNLYFALTNQELTINL